ncbi:MAG: DNA-processing protein DprA [Phycisphaeraceae bacterium]
MKAREHEALLTLMLTPGLGPTLVGRCLDAFGSAEEVMGASANQLAAIRGISPRRSGELLRAMRDTRRSGAPAREIDLCQQKGVQLIALGAPAYPRLLEHIPDPPPLLWVRGELRGDDALALGVVGSRRCTHYGREQAGRLSYQCSQAGLAIVSGGAYGIDAAAHRGALRAGGRTVAVLGSGLEKPYPRDHVDLFAEIAETGALVSELPLHTAPAAENFPRRNRIISGMALGVLVVEAALRSGALITARVCVEDHGRELMALPGRVDSTASAGCHQAIRDGWATLVTGASDILDALGETGQMLKLAEAGDDGEPAPTGDSLFEMNLTDTQAKIVGALAQPRSLDELAAGTGLAVAAVQADLTLLEIRGTIRRENGLFVRRQGN